MLTIAPRSKCSPQSHGTLEYGRNHLHTDTIQKTVWSCEGQLNYIPLCVNRFNICRVERGDLSTYKKVISEVYNTYVQRKFTKIKWRCTFSFRTTVISKTGRDTKPSSRRAKTMAWNTEWNIAARKGLGRKARRLCAPLENCLAIWMCRNDKDWRSWGMYSPRGALKP